MIGVVQRIGLLLALALCSACSSIRAASVRTGPERAPYTGPVAVYAVSPVPESTEVGAVDVRAEDLEARLERLMPVVVQRVAALGGDIAVVDAVDAAFVTKMRPHPETYTYPCGFYTCTGTRVVPMPEEVVTVRVRARALRSASAGAP